MRRTVINTLSLMVLFSSFVFAETGKEAELQKPIKSFNGLTKTIRTQIFSDDFSYSDGSLIGNGSWVHYSGSTDGQVQVSNGTVLINDSDSEDVRAQFAPITSGMLYFGIDVTLADPGSYTGTDFEYFIGFSDTTGYSLIGRVDAAALSATGWSPGVSNGSGAADATWASELNYATTYRIVVGTDASTASTDLWVDPASSSDTKISGTGTPNFTQLSGVFFRQASATPNLSYTLDNLVVSDTFSDVITTTSTPTSGDFTVVLTDSYNDGWDGAYMDVSVNGTVVLSAITVASGASPTTYTFSVEDGDLVETAYTSGSWESEHSYEFFDNFGNLVAQDGPSPGTGISFTADVLVLSGDFTVVLTDSYNDGWDGAYMDVSVNGTVVLSAITVASGASPTTYTFSVEDGDLVETAYTSGSWESEHSYAFYDNLGNSVAQDGPSPGAGISFTADVLEPPANPIIAINYTAVNHGTIVVGDTASFGDVFTVTNDGGGTMTITSVTDLTGTDYITTFDASISLAAGESHSFGFSYIPSDIGVDNVTFTVSSNGGDADIALSGASYGTDYVNEGFEGGVPPAGWEANIVSGTYNWEQSSYWGSFDPGGTGSYTALYNTYSASTGSSAEMITPRLDFTGSASNILSFLYVGTGDLLNIDISDDGGTTWYDVADITDHTNYYVVSYTYDLSAYTGNNVIIKFTALSAYKYRMAMDEVKFPPVYVPPSAPIYISEIVVTPTAGEFVEIFNPNAIDVELSDYYLTDATYAGGGSYYYNIVTGSDYGGGTFGDFHARFPDGAIIAAGNYQTIALAGSDNFNAEYGIAPDYELYEDATVADSIPDMREAVTGSIGGQGSLTNSDEVVVLYFWDGLTDLVKDSDYLLWDDGGEVPNEAVDKTGISVDGPDTDSDASAYLDDTPIADQHFGPSPGYGFSLHRIDYGEGSETSTGGNGIDGHDETSENTDTTFALSLPTPGGAAQLDFFEPNNSFATAVSVSVPDTLTGMAINPIDDLDWFSFSADRWSKVTIDMFINGYSSLDGEIALFDEDSTKLVSADVGFSGGDEQIADFEILTTGTYYIVAGYWGDVRANTGDYALGVAVTPAPYTGFVAGMVSDSETGLAIDSTAVISAYGVVYSGADGAYIFEAPIGQLDVAFEKNGYGDASFTVILAAADTLGLDVVMITEANLGSEVVYSTGFESGDDMGWTFTGGTNPFELSAGFWFDEDYYYYDDSITVAPFAGDSMLVCSPTGYDDNEFSWWMNLTATDMDLSGYGSAELTVQMNYWTEAGYDFVYLLATMPELYGGSYFYLDVNGDGVGNAADGISGFSDGWVEVNADLSPFTGTEYGVEIAVMFVADASVDYGFGVAIDDVVVKGFTEPRPWVEDLMAESFVNDQIALSWSDPSGGQRTMATSTITMNRTPVEVDPRNPRKAFEYETGEEEITINIPAGYSRDLVSYNVFRTDDYGFADYSGFDLIANTADASYTDASVDNDKLYYYFVTAVYDEGESLGSLWAAAGAGEVEDVGMEALAVDFNDSTFGLWNVTTLDDNNGWGIGDSASAVSQYSSIPDNGGYFAFINDDAVGSGYTSESWLISPFFNIGDADHAAITFDYFNESSGQTLNVWAWIGWDTWIFIGELPANNASGWQTVSVDLSGLAGIDHVRLYAYYADNGVWAYSVAMDNISVSTWDGPANLTLTETIEDVTLNWTGLGGRASQDQEPATYEEKTLNYEMYLAKQNRHADQNQNTNTSRQGGDTFADATVIDALPYSNTGTTVGYANDYTMDTTGVSGDLLCDWTGYYSSTTGNAADVVYSLTLAEDTEVVVSLCGSGYDTAIGIFDAATSSLVLGNDDYCVDTYRSEVQCTLPAGTYYIVVDGWGTTEGDYVINVYTPEYVEVPDLLYNIYRDGVLLAELDTTSYVDETATLTEACYEVTALVRTLGVDGDTLNYVETGYSNEACGSVVNQPPGDFILLTPADGDTVMISLDNIGGNQLFAWNASVDPNGTPVEYVICYNIVAPFDQFCDEGITSTAQFVPLQDIVDYIDSLQQAGHGYTVDIAWQVYASDGMDETEAGNGPRTITFDAGYALGVGDELGVPDVFALHQNYPNPFNPVTTIRFDIPQESHVRMDVYNVMGQRVRTLMNGTMQPGFHAVRWDGTNDMGKSLASGMYIYRIQSSKFTSVKKLVLMK